MPGEAPSSFSSPEEVWTSLFDTLCERIGPCFARSETRERVKAYLRGLLSPIERKNGWQLAEEAGLPTPYAMQYLLNRAVWQSDAVRDQLPADVRERLADADGMLVIDETGFLKKGKKSVGVQRQDSGTAGRIENCQVGVFLTYASKAGHTLVDRELYVPKSWTQDPERCRAADVPEGVVFATKPELAARMLWRTLDAGLSARWVTGDTVYGSHGPLRRGLEERSQAYALAVSCQEQVEVQGERKRVDRLADGLEPDQWQRIAVGDGSKGPRDFDWARVELASPEKPGWQKWLVVRRSLPEGGHPAELAYVLVFAPCGTTLAEMAVAIGTRWTVEQCFEEGKGEVGLDHYEVRSWQGWYRHITLCMLAHAFLVVLRTQSQMLMEDPAADEQKKAWKPCLPHSPSQSLSAFKRQRGLACPCWSLSAFPKYVDSSFTCWTNRRSRVSSVWAGPFSAAPIKLSPVAVTTNVVLLPVHSYHCSTSQLLAGLPAEWRESATTLFCAWEQAVRASSTVENWHSVVRPFLAVHRTLSAGMLALLAVWHNHRVAPRGLHKGQSPIQRSGIQEQAVDWLVTLGYPPTLPALAIGSLKPQRPGRVA